MTHNDWLRVEDVRDRVLHLLGAYVATVGPPSGRVLKVDPKPRLLSERKAALLALSLIPNGWSAAWRRWYHMDRWRRQGSVMTAEGALRYAIGLPVLDPKGGVRIDERALSPEQKVFVSSRLEEVVYPPYLERPPPAPYRTPDVLEMARLTYEYRTGREECKTCKGRGRRALKKTRKGEDAELCLFCKGFGYFDNGKLDPGRVVVLADALEEAGCTNELLPHLRREGEHVRGCWAVDFLLGKE